MPITTSDIRFYLTGGESNTNPYLSLGGNMSSTQVLSGQLNNLFDDVTGDESAVGDTEYRCIAIKNNHETLTLKASKVWVLANTTSEDDHVEIGVETPSANKVQTVADESTAPVGVTFNQAPTKAAGHFLTGEGNSNGEIGPGKWAAIWIKRVVQAGASAKDNNSFQIQVEGDTNE